MVDEEQGYLWNRHHQIKVRVLSNRIYQQERQRRFEWREGIVKAMSIIAGSVAFANVANQSLAKWCFFLITVLNIFSLVFSYGAKARESSKRATDWTLLERDIDGIGERGFNEEHLNQWAARCNEIEAGEPSAHSILFELSAERACEALGGKYDSKLWRIQRIFPILFLH